MIYPSIRIEGAILSPDILDRLEDLPGQKPGDFGLDSSARVKDEIARAWADAQDYWRIFQRRMANSEQRMEENGPSDHSPLSTRHSPLTTHRSPPATRLPLAPRRASSGLRRFSGSLATSSSTRRAGLSLTASSTASPTVP